MTVWHPLPPATGKDSAAAAQQRLGGWLALQSRLPPSVLVILGLAAFYCLMFQRYRAYDIDNPWFLSFAYNLLSGASDKDVFLGMSFPRGMDGTFYFGKAAAYVLSAPLELTGWLPRAASLIVIGFVTASLALWRSALASWGMSERFTASFLLVLGLTEPVVTAAEKFRYEFFAFFLLSLAIGLTSRRQAFLALWVAFCSVETEPAAIVCPLAVCILLQRDPALCQRLALKTAAAAAVAFAAYELLHPHALAALLSAPLTTAAQLPPAGAYWPGQMLGDYFVMRPRHWADLGFLLAGYGLLWHGLLQRGRLPQHGADSEGGERLQGTLVRIVLALLAVFFVSPHANAAYMVFAMPFLVLLALSGYLGSHLRLRGYAQPRQLRWVPLVFASVLLAQYGALYYVNYHEGFEPAEFAQVRAGIAAAERQLHLDDAHARIVGDYSVWFAHPRNFNAELERAVTGDIFLCFDQALQPGGLAWPNVPCGTLRQRVALREVSQLNLLGHELHILTTSGRP